METVDKGHGSLLRNILNLPLGFIRMASNGVVDDRQEILSHDGGQRRPSIDRSLKISWNACGHVGVSCNRRLRRTARHAKNLAETNAYYFCTGVLKLGQEPAVSPVTIMPLGDLDLAPRD